MDTWEILAVVFATARRYGPVAIMIAHDIVHDLQQAQDENVRKKADEVHAALHGEDHVRPHR